MKVLYFDCETTGTDPIEQDITQISGLIEIDGKVVDKFNFRCQPLNWDGISPEALEAWNRDPAAYVETTHNETYVTRSRGNLTFEQRLASFLSGVYKKLFFGKGVN